MPNAITGKCDPYGAEAGVLAQKFADGGGDCDYPDCDESHVTCVVHREGANSAFIKVCNRHRGWELAKTGVSVWDWD